TWLPGPGGGVEGLDPLRRRNFETLLKRLGEIVPTRGLTLLDVGCSTGLFLETAARYGIDGVGIEPEPGQASIARLRGVKVRDGFFPDSLRRGETFDIVAFNDVFEHLSDPCQVLHACELILNPGGVLILNLPDSAGVLYSVASALARIGLENPL
ncbi:3-demethylubiquinone-9 3-methyltransferase, partial [mine drainage metagenome]